MKKGLNTKECEELTSLLEKMSFDQAIQTMRHITHKMEYGEYQE